MTIPKWLLPVIGVIAAIAVGIAAVLIGMRFTAPVDPVLATEEAPILAPADPADLANTDDPYVVSDEVGESEIVTPGQDGVSEIDAGAQSMIDELDAAGGYAPTGTSEAPADDPVPADGDDAEDPLDVDDPCATADPPVGCPIGVTGIVLADSRVPNEPIIALDPDPAADASAGTGVYCDPGTADPAPGTIWIGVGGNVPMDITLTYSPVDDPSDEHVATVSTSAADRTAWDRDYTRRHAYRDNYWWFQHCVQLTGLGAGDYRITAEATDLIGRSPLPRDAVFNAEGDPTEPPITVVPLNSSLLYVSVPSPSGVDARRPSIRTWIAQEGEATDCSDFGESRELTMLQLQTPLPVDAAFLEANNYDPLYRSRDVVIYDVPEGVQLVICARWYSTPDHSWESGLDRQRTLTVSSPNGVTPTIGIESIDLGREVEADGVVVSVSMPSGLPCGPGWSGPEVAAGPEHIDLGVGICDASTRGFDGRVVVTTTVAVGDDLVTRSQVLQLERRHCTGVCALPPTSRYLVNLPTIRVGAGMCSGDGCTPPTRETSLGRVTLIVQWAEGNVSTIDRWMVGDVDDALPAEGPEGEAPRFDTTTVPTTSHSPDGFEGIISTKIVLDRPGNYRAHLSGDCIPDGVNPTIAGVWDGHSAYPTVTWTGLCGGGNFFITIKTWDDATNQNTYDFSGTGDERWVDSVVPLLAVRIDVDVDVTVYTPNASHPGFGINTFAFDLGSPSAPLVDYGTGADHCAIEDGSVRTHFQLWTGQQHDYTVTLRVPVFEQLSAFAPTGGPEDQCGFERIEYAWATATMTIPHDQLVPGNTLLGPMTYEDPADVGFYPELWTRISLRGTRAP